MKDNRRNVVLLNISSREKQARIKKFRLERDSSPLPLQNGTITKNIHTCRWCKIIVSFPIPSQGHSGQTWHACAIPAKTLVLKVFALTPDIHLVSQLVILFQSAIFIMFCSKSLAHFSFQTLRLTKFEEAKTGSGMGYFGVWPLCTSQGNHSYYNAMQYNKVIVSLKGFLRFNLQVKLHWIKIIYKIIKRHSYCSAKGSMKHEDDNNHYKEMKLYFTPHSYDCMDQIKSSLNVKQSYS